jgi:hypothetical protein
VTISPDSAKTVEVEITSQDSGTISNATNVVRLATWPKTALQEATTNSLAIDVEKPGTWHVTAAIQTFAKIQENRTDNKGTTVCKTKTDNKGTTVCRTKAQQVATAADKRVTSLGIAHPKRNTVRQENATNVESLDTWPEIVPSCLHHRLRRRETLVKKKASPQRKTRMAIVTMVVMANVTTVEAAVVTPGEMVIVMVVMVVAMATVIMAVIPGETTNLLVIRFIRPESRTTGHNDTNRWTIGQNTTMMVLKRPT